MIPPGLRRCANRRKAPRHSRPRLTRIRSYDMGGRRAAPCVLAQTMYTVPKLDDYSPDALDRAVADLFAALDSETAALGGESDWKTFRDRWLARKNGVLTHVNDIWLKAAPGPAKREVGQRVNQLKSRAEAAIEAAQTKLHASSSDSKLAAERLDITLPGIQRP